MSDEQIPPLPEGLARLWAERLLNPNPEFNLSLETTEPAKRLAVLRQLLGLTRRQLSQAIDVAQAKLVGFEQGIFLWEEFTADEQERIDQWVREAQARLRREG